MKIRNTAEIVKEILEQKPRARDCDFVLYGFVLNKYGYSVSIPFNELANSAKTGSIYRQAESITQREESLMRRITTTRTGSKKARRDLSMIVGEISTISKSITARNGSEKNKRG